MTYPDYYPYGKTLRQFVGVDEKFLTTQNERDQETGLDYRGARFYDSDIARFLSLDPLAADYPSLSDYSYVAGNPVRYIDGTGKYIELPENRRDRRRINRWINKASKKSETMALLINDLEESANAHSFSIGDNNETELKDGSDGSSITLTGFLHLLR
jgi:RHS repeat-associated protein